MHNMMKLEYRLLVSLLYNYDEPSENIIRVLKFIKAQVQSTETLKSHDRICMPNAISIKNWALFGHNWALFKIDHH